MRTVQYPRSLSQFRARRHKALPHLRSRQLAHAPTAILCHRWFALLFVVAVVVASPQKAYSVIRNWDNPGGNGTWSVATNWSGDTVPGSSDSAVFDIDDSYTVTFSGNAGPIQALTVRDGVTFASSVPNGAPTLFVNAPNGTQDVDVVGTLTLGTSANGPVGLTIGDTLSGGPITAQFGSDIASNAVTTGSLLTVTGSGSTLTANTGSLNGSLTVSSSGSATFNNSLLASGFTLSGSGTLNVGPQGSQTTTFTLHGSGSVSGSSVLTVNGNTSFDTDGVFLVSSSGSTIFQGNLLTSNNGLNNISYSNSTGNIIDGLLGLSHLGSPGIGNLDVGQSSTLSVGSLALGRGQVLVSFSSEITTNGNLSFGTVNLPDRNATVNNSGTITQSGSSAITIGSTATGTDTVNLIGSFANLTSGTGQLTINKSGVVNIPAVSRWNQNGRVVIDGGQLLSDAASTAFNWSAAPASRIMDVINGGLASFAGNYATTSQAVYNVADGGTLRSTAGTFTVGNGATVNVSDDGLLSAGAPGALNTLSVNGGQVDLSSNGDLTANALNVGTADAAGTVTADGSGSLVQVTTLTTIGAAGRTGTITFRNNAQGDFPGGVNLATSSTTGTAGTLNVQSGADLTNVGDVNIATSGGSTTQGLLAISGAGSSVTLNSNGDLTVGHSSSGTGTVDIAGGSLTVGNGRTTTINSTGTIRLNGGSANLRNLVVNSGGTLDFIAGSLSYTGNLTVGTGSNAYFGSNVSLTNRQLAITGSTTVGSGAQLVVDGLNSLSTGSLSNSGLIRGDGVIAATGTMTNNSSGEIRAESGKTIKLQGNNGTNSGSIFLQGGTAEFTNALTNGVSGQIVGAGTLVVGGSQLTNNGNIAFSTGTTSVFGDVVNAGSVNVSGNGNATFWDDFAHNAGALLNVSSGSSATFFGFSGPGSITGSGQVNFEGDISPGASPAAVTYSGDVSLGGNAQLIIEIGGTTPGTQYDHVSVGGLLELGGTLNVDLLSFAPAANDVFDILDWGSLTGTFATIDLPALGWGLDWDDSALYTQGVLSVVGLGTDGDFDDDSDVDSHDIDILWNVIRPEVTGDDDPGADDTEDLNGDGYVNEDDVDYLLANLLSAGPNRQYGDADLDGGVGGLDHQAWVQRAGTGWAHGDWDGDGGIGGLDFQLWVARPTAYPGTVGPHPGSASPSMVPEPASFVLLILGLPLLAAAVHRRSR